MEPPPDFQPGGNPLPPPLKGLDLYKLLGVEESVDMKGLRKAYRKKALLLHPDKNKDNVENARLQFHQLTKVYEFLLDLPSKKRYDEYLLQNRRILERRNRLSKEKQAFKERLERREREGSVGGLGGFSSSSCAFSSFPPSSTTGWRVSGSGGYMREGGGPQGGGFSTNTHMGNNGLNSFKNPGLIKPADITAESLNEMRRINAELLAQREDEMWRQSEGLRNFFSKYNRNHPESSERIDGAAYFTAFNLGGNDGEFLSHQFGADYGVGGRIPSFLRGKVSSHLHSPHSGFVGGKSIPSNLESGSNRGDERAAFNRCAHSFPPHNMMNGMPHTAATPHDTVDIDDDEVQFLGSIKPLQSNTHTTTCTDAGDNDVINSQSSSYPPFRDQSKHSKPTHTPGMKTGEDSIFSRSLLVKFDKVSKDSTNIFKEAFKGFGLLLLELCVSETYLHQAFGFPLLQTTADKEKVKASEEAESSAKEAENGGISSSLSQQDEEGCVLIRENTRNIAVFSSRLNTLEAVIYAKKNRKKFPFKCTLAEKVFGDSGGGAKRSSECFQVDEEGLRYGEGMDLEPGNSPPVKISAGRKTGSEDIPPTKKPKEHTQPTEREPTASSRKVIDISKLNFEETSLEDFEAQILGDFL